MNYLPVAVYTGCSPAEGRKTVPVPLTLAANSGVDIDLTLMRETARISGVQTIFVDNSTGTGHISILFPVSQHSITVNPKTQGYYPVIMAAQDTRFIITSTATGDVKLQLLNFMIAPYNWEVQ